MNLPTPITPMSTPITPFLFTLILLCAIFTPTSQGPLTCSACFAAMGLVATGTGTSIGGCYALLVPQAICTCIAGLGLSVSIYAIYVCGTICFTPTP